SNRVTADTLSELLCGASALVAASALASSGRGSLVRALGAGAIAGLAVLSKGSGLLCLPAYALAEGLPLASTRERRASIRMAIARVVSFGAGFAVAGSWWPALVLARTGSARQALGIGGANMSAAVWQTPWLRFACQRPFWTVPFANLWWTPLVA